MIIKFFKAQSDFHNWLLKNHDKIDEIWIGFWKVDSKQKGITYSHALDEALCFGWIDGIRKSINDDSYKIRFTPRKKNSKWSKVNIKRANEFLKSEQMQPSGLKAFGKREEGNKIKYSLEEKIEKLSPDFEKKFRADKNAWEFFQLQPPYYKRTASFWVMSAKKEESRQRRFEILFNDSANKKRIDVLNSKLYQQKRQQNK